MPQVLDKRRLNKSHPLAQPVNHNHRSRSKEHPQPSAHKTNVHSTSTSFDSTISRSSHNEVGVLAWHDSNAMNKPQPKQKNKLAANNAVKSSKNSENSRFRSKAPGGPKVSQRIETSASKSPTKSNVKSHNHKHKHRASAYSDSDVEDDHTTEYKRYRAEAEAMIKRQAEVVTQADGSTSESADDDTDDGATTSAGTNNKTNNKAKIANLSAYGDADTTKTKHKRNRRSNKQSVGGGQAAGRSNKQSGGSGQAAARVLKDSNTGKKGGKRSGDRGDARPPDGNDSQFSNAGMYLYSSVVVVVVVVLLL